MVIITQNRIRSIVADCKTEHDLEQTLRHHKIRFHYSTDSGFLSVLIPSATGTVRVYRTASRVAPFAVAPVAPMPYQRPEKMYQKLTQSA